MTAARKMTANEVPESRPTCPRCSAARLAQELAKWAETQPGGEAIHDALFRAYFVDGRNIGDAEVLADVAASVGLPRDDAMEVMRTRSFKAHERALCPCSPRGEVAGMT